VDEVTMKITKKKNRRMGQTIHQETTGANRGIAALTRRVQYILSHNSNDKQTICNVHDNIQWYTIIGTDMMTTVHQV
jgi:hypothetical protein